ncbi:ubiquitin-protein ligase (E3) [Coemansia sp. RSA 1939]|nr:ubiquitin-protein ligase (E3) [Coemansia sp. RSA 1939]KAJ2613991.1 ubiquitin-protein ligase (E3) [Coemansia sp. RSA 1804]
MFGFQGDFRKQRNINLGGNRRNGAARSNTQSVLNKAHEEREKREQERRKQKAAMFIQHFISGHQDTAKWRHRMRCSLDLSCLDAVSPQKLDALYSTLLGFVSYYSGSAQDIDTHSRILHLLFDTDTNSAGNRSLSRYSKIVSFLALQHDSPLSVSSQKWAQLLSKLLGLPMKVRYNRNGDNAQQIDAPMLLNSILQASAVDNKRSNSQTDNNRIEFAECLLTSLVVSHKLYPFLTRCISTSKRHAGDNTTELAINVSVLPMAFTSLKDKVVLYFAQWILSIPGLPTKIGVRGVTSLSRAHVPWSALARSVKRVAETWHQNLQRDPGFVDEIAQSVIFEKKPSSSIALPLVAISMLGNLTAFVLPQLSHTEKPTAESTDIDMTFIDACAACARTVPVCDLFEPKKTLSTSDSIGYNLVRVVDPLALKWLNSVFSTQVLRLLVDASCHGGSTYSSTAEELLLMFIQRWGVTINRAVVDNIFQAVDIRTIGWRAVLQDQKFVEDFAGAYVTVRIIKGHNLVKFQLLCEVLNRQLQSIGDDELFSQEMSLPVDEIKIVARICRNTAFALYWSQETSGALVHLREISAELTRQLFVRDMRHKFVDDKFWLMPPSLLEMSSFADTVVEDPMFLPDSSSAEDGGSDDSDSDMYSDESDADSDDVTSALASASTSRGAHAPNSQFGRLVNTYSQIAHKRQGHIGRTVITPRIAVLKNIPFVVPFNDRVRLFHALVNRDRASIGLASLGNGMNASPYGRFPSTHATIRRGHVFDDGFHALYPVLSGRPVSEVQQQQEQEQQRARPFSQQASGRNIVNRAASDAAQTATRQDLPFSAPDEQQRPIAQVQVPGSRGFDIVSWPFEQNMAQGWNGSSVGDMLDPNDPFEFARRAENQAAAMQTMASLGRLDRATRINIFKQRMQIEFEDRYGMPEAGIDGGGLFKEFLTSLIQEAFSPQMELFSETRQNSLYPSPNAVTQGDSAKSRALALEKFEFLGAVIGKALYEGVLVDVPFAQFFIGECLNQLPGFNDLPTLDEDLYRGLVALKNYQVTETQPRASGSSSGGRFDGADEEDEIYRVFGLDFTVTVNTRDGTAPRTVPLVPKGETVKVTAQNRLLYLDLIAQYKLVKQIEAPTRAFMAGLHAIVPPVWLRLLFASPLELSRLLCGDSGAIDVADWKRNTVYEGAYREQGSSHPTIVAFWDVVENRFSETQRRKLCKFATSCERPPLLGFAELNPRFCISGTSVEEERSRLPSASTCVNLLKMPPYGSPRILWDKLTTAIESNSGFLLS